MLAGKCAHLQPSAAAALVRFCIVHVPVLLTLLLCVRSCIAAALMRPDLLISFPHILTWKGAVLTCSLTRSLACSLTH